MYFDRLERRVGDSTVADRCAVVYLVKAFNVNFLTGALRGVKYQHWSLFHYRIYLKKNKRRDMVLPVFSKVGLGNNRPML